MQTYSGKVVAFSEEEVGSYQPTAPAPSSPLKRLSSQLSKVGLAATHNKLPDNAGWRQLLALVCGYLAESLQ